MNTRLLGQSLTLWHLDKHRPLPWWISLTVSAGVGCVVGVLVVFVAALLSGQILDPTFWQPGLLPSALLGVAIALLTHGAFRLLERLLPAAQLQQLNEGTARGSLLVFIGIPTACSVLGLVVVDTLLMSYRLGLPVPPRMPNKGTLITFLFCGAGFAALSLWRLRSQLRAQKTRSQLTQAQLRLLQAQIEPHFLFNSLANVAALIDAEPALAGRLLDALIRYLRSSLQRTRAERGSLGDEVALLTAYLDVLKIRMGERLDYAFEIPPDLMAREFPPMLLQPLVENAIRHGLEPKLAGGRLRVSAAEGDGCLRIVVSDDGVGFGDTAGDGVGLANVRARLAALYGPEARMLVNSGVGAGVTATLELPRAAMA